MEQLDSWSGGVPEGAMPLWSPSGIPAQSSRLQTPWTINVGLDVDIRWFLRKNHTESYSDPTRGRDRLEFSVASAQGDNPDFEAFSCSDGAPDVECHGLTSNGGSQGYMASSNHHDRLVITTGRTWPGSLDTADARQEGGYVGRYGTSANSTQLKALAASSPEAQALWKNQCHLEFGDPASAMFQDPSPLVPAIWSHLQPFGCTLGMAVQSVLAGVRARGTKASASWAPLLALKQHWPLLQLSQRHGQSG